MSKTGAWIMELQEQFEDKVADIIKESENVAEAYATAVKLNNENHYVSWDNMEVECLVDVGWSDVWSEYH